MFDATQDTRLSPSPHIQQSSNALGIVTQSLRLTGAGSSSRGLHLYEDLVQPLQGTVQMYLDPARRTRYGLSSETKKVCFI